MSDERIITDATVTSSENGDSSKPERQVKLNRKNDMLVEIVIGDAALPG